LFQRLRQNSRPSLTDLPFDNQQISPPAKLVSAQSVETYAAKKEGFLSGLKSVFLGRRSDSRENSGISATQPQNGHPGGYEHRGGFGGLDEIRAQMEQLLGIFAEQISRD
jgi:hypothetical protein